jgi:hypothetical protein
VLTLDAGISISWAPDPDGSYEHGARHHADEERSFRARLDAAAPAVEVVFDELESAGRHFLSPGERSFAAVAQRGRAGVGEIFELEVACTPPFSEAELTTLAARVSALVA